MKQWMEETPATAAAMEGFEEPSNRSDEPAPDEPAPTVPKPGPARPTGTGLLEGWTALTYERGYNEGVVAGLVLVLAGLGLRWLMRGLLR